MRSDSVLVSTEIIKNRKKIGGAIKTLFWFVDKIQDMEPNQDPTVYADPEMIAKDLNVSKRTAGRHLKILRDYDYILQIKPRHHVYEVNPKIVLKGNSDEE